MRIGVPRERGEEERRVAMTPEATAKLVARGHTVVIERGAGLGAHHADADYEAAGATLADATAVWGLSELVVKIASPTPAEAILLPEGGKLVSLLWKHEIGDVLPILRSRKATAIGLERIPRTTIAQKFDALSSMANIAGYRAVLEAAAEHGSFLGLQMTAAGKKPPARVLVIGAGVAGLAAIGAARALGADVRAFDTRAAVGEEVRSLGATFLEVELEETGDGGGGYARVKSPEFIAAEMELFRAQAKEVDIVVTTALIPGRKAPILWDRAMVESMKPGSVVVDLAAAQGGNCELTKPQGRVDHGGVVILGYTDLTSRMAADSSRFFANNIAHLLRHMEGDEPGTLIFDPTERTVGPAYVLADGEEPPSPTPQPPRPAPIRSATVSLVRAPKAAPPTPLRRVAGGLGSLVAASALMALGMNAPQELVQHLTVFVLACFVGWQVIWNVTAALHTPLMAVTNAISGIIIVGGLLQAGGGELSWAAVLGATAILFAAINVAGGFLVTHRMLQMFRRDQG